MDEPSNSNISVSQPYACVWDAICENPVEARIMRIRSELLVQIHRKTIRRKCSIVEFCRRYSITEIDYQNIKRARLTLFSTDDLIAIATKLGLNVEIAVS